METETYVIESELKLADGTVVGRTNHSPVGFRHMYGDWCRIGIMAHDTYDLLPDYQGLHEDTVVYFGRG